jgi:hypothetical protein
MNYWRNLMNSGLLIGSTFLVPIISSAVPLPKDNIAISESKPLRGGEIKPDKPLPAEDIKATPVEDIPYKDLSQSQVNVMKAMLQDAKKRAMEGNLSDGIMAFNEFAAGPWEEAAQQLKKRSPNKHKAIDASIKKIDDIIRKTSKNNMKPTRLKFIKEVTKLINAVTRAGQTG